MKERDRYIKIDQDQKFYFKIGSKESVRKIYKIVKKRTKTEKDRKYMRAVKDENDAEDNIEISINKMLLRRDRIKKVIRTKI